MRGVAADNAAGPVRSAAMFNHLVGFFQGAGYLGIVALMFLENLFPPIPSELIMPLAGFEAAQGEASLFLVIASGTLGSVLGALFWYQVGRSIGAPALKTFAARHGRLLTLGPADVDRVDRAFERNSAVAIFAGRMVPAVRTLISVPAGMFGMNLARFILYTTLGSAAWSGLLAFAGYGLEREYARVAAYLDPASYVVVGAILFLYAYRVIRWKPH
jgi:membrane protein DedA with SNARE-associated domain